MNPLFVTNIIVNDQYQKYQRSRYVIFILLAVLAIPFYLATAMLGEIPYVGEMNIYKAVGFAVIAVFLIAYAEYYYATYRSFQFEKIGVIEFFEDRIFISPDEGENVEIILANNENVTVRRRTAYHKESYDYDYEDGWTRDPFGRKKYQFYPGNNLLEFSRNGEETTYEFLIKSKEHNRQFERMIGLLRFNKLRNLTYLSV